MNVLCIMMLMHMHRPLSEHLASYAFKTCFKIKHYNCVVDFSFSTLYDRN